MESLDVDILDNDATQTWNAKQFSLLNFENWMQKKKSTWSTYLEPKTKSME